jgi:4-methylaminobutanoate oxidase (formaldehyde-forming)
LGNTDVLAVRIGYVGELGFELYVRPENALHLYEALWHAGRDLNIANAGYYAIESCRLEKGYVYWSSDIGPDVNPYQAGLGFCVALDKKVFTGRHALQALSGQQDANLLTTLYYPEFLPVYGGEPIFSDGQLTGYTTSAGYGHRLGRTIAYAYLPRVVTGRTYVDVEAFGKLYKFKIGPRCLYDADNRRLKA